MKIVLQGNWPATLTAGILLLSRGRSFGLPLSVRIVGEPKDAESVLGPAVVSCQVLASCSVGRELGDGPTVVVTGGSTDPVLVSINKRDPSGWFFVDSCGDGWHPATKSFVRMVRDNRPCSRKASSLIMGLLRWAGVPAEPAILDLLFGAPVDPLTRVGMTLRASATVTNSRVHRSVSERLSGGIETPLASEGLTGDKVFELWRSGDLADVFGALPPSVAASVDDWLRSMEEFSDITDGDGGELVASLATILGNVLLLPQGCILPTLNPTREGLAKGMVKVLGAREKDSDAIKSLVDVYRFLGGRFELSSPYPFQLTDSPAPDGHIERWMWMIDSVEAAAEQMEKIWNEAMSPSS